MKALLYEGDREIEFRLLGFLFYQLVLRARLAFISFLNEIVNEFASEVLEI